MARILCFASGGLHIRQSAIQSSIILLWLLLSVRVVAGQTEPVVGLYENNPRIFILRPALCTPRHKLGFDKWLFVSLSAFSFKILLFG